MCVFKIELLKFSFKKNDEGNKYSKFPSIEASTSSLLTKKTLTWPYCYIPTTPMQNKHHFIKEFCSHHFSEYLGEVGFLHPGSQES